MASPRIVVLYLEQAELKLRRPLVVSEMVKASRWASSNTDDVVMARINAMEIEIDAYWDSQMQAKEAAQDAAVAERKMTFTVEPRYQWSRIGVSAPMRGTYMQETDMGIYLERDAVTGKIVDVG